MYNIGNIYVNSKELGLVVNLPTKTNYSSQKYVGGTSFRLENDSPNDDLPGLKVGLLML